MSQKEMTAPAPVADRAEPPEVALPAPDLSVLTEQPAVEPVKDEKTKQDKQELTETTPASVGLVVALVVVSIVVAVVVAMWMVSPLMALLLGAGLIVVAVLAGAGWLAWRKFTRRTKNGGGRDGSGRAGGAGTSPRGGSKPNGGKSGGLWPFSRNANGGKPTGGGKSGGIWPFSRNTNGGKAPTGGGKTNGGGKAPTSGSKPTGGGKTNGGSKPNGGGKSGGIWPFSRNTNGGKAPTGGGKTNGGGKAPTSGSKPTGGGKTNGGSKPAGGSGAGKTKPGGGSVLLGLLARAVKDKNKTKNSGGDQAGDKQRDGKDDKGRTRQAPGGHRPETVIDVDLDDITSPGVWPGPAASGPTAPRSAPRTAPPPFDPGTTDRSGWFDRVVPTSLRNTPHHQTPVSNPYGGPEMSTTTTTGGDIDQDAMRVANRYAGLIAKQETLMGRASACRDAADQYRRDARANQESAENHKQAARTIRDVNVAAEHGRQAREAEAEAAREILAARYYEEQAETYEAEARAIGF